MHKKHWNKHLRFCKPPSWVVISDTNIRILGRIQFDRIPTRSISSFEHFLKCFRPAVLSLFVNPSLDCPFIMHAIALADLKQVDLWSTVQTNPSLYSSINVSLEKWMIQICSLVSLLFCATISPILFNFQSNLGLDTSARSLSSDCTISLSCKTLSFLVRN